ncbi:MAG: hypothetical protein IJM97_03865 [Clostridia bacterium]|nr:hypothetical protein [Clostridia bacterium]
MEKTKDKKIKIRFKNKGAAIIAIMIAVLVLALVCLGIWGIVSLATRNANEPETRELYPDFTITTLSGSPDSTPNSLSYIKNAATCGAQMIEVDLMFNTKGEPVLTDKYDLIDADATVPLIKALEILKEYPDISLLLDLHALTNLSRVEELAERYNMFGKIFYSGVTLNNMDYVLSNSPNIQVFLELDLSSHNADDLEFYDYIRDYAINAYALNIDFDDLDYEWAELLVNDGHKISVYDVSSKSEFRTALNMFVANITTDKPGELQAYIIDWLTA